MQTENSEDLAYERIKEKLADKYWRMNNLYYIKDKDGKKIKFKFNWAQEKFHKERHNRNLILKARQLGFTTYKCIDKLDDVLFNSYLDAGIICHTVDDAEKIFNHKVKFAFDNLPQWLRDRRKPNTDKAGELRFPNHSSISVSAGFRGGTLAGGLHVSEYGKICAKYPEKAREIKSGALNAVPIEADADFESTAEGMDGDFYKMVTKAQLIDDKDLSPLDFKLHFFSWWQASEYRLNPVGIKIPDELQDYFATLEADHGIKLDVEQRAWYFKKSEEQDQDMHQEYPSFPEEAFMASGRPVFNREKIARDIKRAKDVPYKRGIATTKGFEENARGNLSIFKEPVKGEAYAIGADVAEGLADGDFSTATVLNKNFEQVAAYKGHLDPDLFGRMLVNLAKYYNNALLAPELNNHGHATLAAIKNENYYQVYRREVQEELGKEIQDKVGWLNNVKSKAKMLDDFKAAYRDGSLKLNHEETLREMLTLTLEEDGNVILNSKDLCVSVGLAIQGLTQAVVPESMGAFESGGNKQRFETLEQMLKWSQNNKSEESYFD
jgi:hypothetical protein